MRKGQTALEYLITYGWAIIVVLVVTAVLWYFGIFNPGRWVSDQVAGFSSFSIAPQGSYNILLTGVGTAEMTLFAGNRVGDRLLITNVSVGGNDCTGYNETLGAEANILPGGRSGGMHIDLTCAASLRSGDMVTLGIVITFNDITTGLQNKTDAGTMMIKLG
jgi:hypothetical protein